MAHDVFISYAHQDKPIADAVCAALEQRQIRCWIAPRDVLPGRAYGHAIVEALDASEIFVLVFSSHANASPQVEREVERAAAKRLAILPFRVEDVPLSKHMEYFISAPHWLDAMSPPLERHLGFLGDAVAALLAAESGKAPPPPPGVQIRQPYAPAQPTPARPSRRAWLAGIVGAAALAGVGLIGYQLLRQEPARQVDVKSNQPSDAVPKAIAEAKPDTGGATKTAEPPAPAPKPPPQVTAKAPETRPPPAPAPAKPSASVPPTPRQPATGTSAGDRVTMAPPASVPPAPPSTPRGGLGETSPHSPNYKLPTRWQDYKGFSDLVGRWRGTDRGGIVIEMEVPATEAAEVTALLKIERMNCQMSLRLVRATEMFTTSQFFWKPGTASPGCPEMESLYTMPVTNGMTWRYTFTDGKQVQVAMSRRI